MNILLNIVLHKLNNIILLDGCEEWNFSVDY